MSLGRGMAAGEHGRGECDVGAGPSGSILEVVRIVQGTFAAIPARQIGVHSYSPRTAPISCSTGTPPPQQAASSRRGAYPMSPVRQLKTCARRLQQLTMMLAEIP